jgi:hypothetical protein
MSNTSPGHRALRQIAGAVGAVTLLGLGAAPAGAVTAEPGVVLGRIAPISGVKPGSDFNVPASFTNTSTTALDKVWITYSVTHGLNYTEVPSNCLRYDYTPYDELPSKSVVECEFDQTVEPGVVYAPEKALTLKALDSALYDQLGVSVYSSAPGSAGDQDPVPVRGTGPAVKLVERPDDTPAAPGSAQHNGWDAAIVDVTADNTADFQVTGALLRGKVGLTVPLTVKFTNAGPGWVLRDIGVSPADVRIKIPAGTAVVKASGYCKSLGSGTYDCGTGESWVYEHSGETYDFTLRIDKAVPGAKGSVTFAGLPRPFDPIKSNDTADILLDATGAGATGGSGSTTSTGGSSTTGTPGSSSTGGDLANTGSGSVLPVTAAAAGALVLGAGAFLVARRRAA